MTGAVTVLRAAATSALAVLVAFGPACGCAGAAGGGAAVGGHAGVRATHPGDPYGSGGLLVRLPGGGTVRLARPKGAPDGRGAGLGGLPFVPMPVLGPLFHGVLPTPVPTATPVPTRPGPGAAGSGAPSVSVGAGVADGAASGAGSWTGSGGGDAVDSARPPWGPVRQGPPPLGPQALAPRSVAGALSDLNVDAVRSAAGRDARDERASRRLLPLGIGLALIGGGSALFGWRLRRI